MTRLFVAIVVALILSGCATPKPACDQPITYYNSPSPALWPHCE